MRILFIGDIVGSPGRQIVHERLADLVEQRQIDLVIANGENSASGFGITPRLAEGLLGNGIEVLTGGNHSWDRKEIMEYMPHQPRLLRPANFPEGNPGTGLYVGAAKNGVKFAVFNLQGRVFLPAIDDPFKKADSELAKGSRGCLLRARGHARGNHQRKDRSGLVSRWPGDRRRGHTHSRNHRRRTRPAQWTAYIPMSGMTGPHDGLSAWIAPGF